MVSKLSINVTPGLYLKDPVSSVLGNQLVAKSVDLLYELGFEQFNFKKLSQAIPTTEASIYRYFESKYKILLYLLHWYWSYLEFCIRFDIPAHSAPEEQLREIIRILVGISEVETILTPFDLYKLNTMVIRESSKVYLIKEVEDFNREKHYKPYKDLILAIAEKIQLLNPQFRFPKSLATTIVETAHDQQYFSLWLKGLTDVGDENGEHYVVSFLENLVFSALRNGKGE
ncbi:MAG: TetR/AcrR family transcriptional regulator [Saprospiraceae bacterium]|nr:TetR/AcrR family transcriptional regulator [Saprospiraceae bacterium]